MSNDLQDTIGRIVWQDGQVLASKDLRAGLQDEARHRRLHNHYLHATWGITIGFDVQFDPGNSRVIVSPGAAVDIEGRDLLLSETLYLDAPADGVFILAATYEPGPCRPTLQKADFCPGLNPNNERASVAWIPEDAFVIGEQVPLARAQFAGGKIAGGFDQRIRRYAARMVRPHVASGVTAAGSTGWIDKSIPKVSNMWLQADVDTSAAGFLQKPRYFAALRRDNPPRKNVRPGSLNDVAAVFGSQPTFSLDGPGHIVKPSASQFTFRMPRGPLPIGIDMTAAEAELGGWTIAWIGVEPLEGGSLQIGFQTLLTLLGNLI